ncbi:phytase [Pholiota conissans]|uniref:Phytase A n=1 Tax=Pholiota conissans TaxID=109636 RepID=A0A9P5YY84_9AGAR|nr:phytase [Pholiota conissans]
MFLSFASIWVLFSGIHLCLGSSLPKVITQFAPPAVQQSWAAYTPYFSVKPYTPPPRNCRITQVNILQRHGARFPTSGATTGILSAVTKLQSAGLYTNPRLNFLRNYTYTLGKNGDLVPFGAFQSEEAGKVAYERYGRLISQKNLPFVRASSSVRVVNSATNWTSGFSIASNHVFNPELSVVLSESLNDTLDDSMCPNAGSSDPQTDTWTAIYGAPIAARLNSQALGSNLTAADISNLIPLCPFESAAKEETSPFCAIFTADDFAQFEYFGDLDKFYGTGYGQALGPVQGVGYVNELLARLTGTSVNDSTQTNRTLDASPVTFPLDRSVYADFSHDNQMAAIYAALGLFKQPQPLDPTTPSRKRTWVTSHLTPFSARMVTERLQCSARRNQKTGAYVRILVNDALQPLEFCNGDQDGLCTLDAFVESQAFARNNGAGDFEKCFN